MNTLQCLEGMEKGTYSPCLLGSGLYARVYMHDEDTAFKVVRNGNRDAWVLYALECMRLEHDGNKPDMFPTVKEISFYRDVHSDTRICAYIELLEDCGDEYYDTCNQLSSFGSFNRPEHVNPYEWEMFLETSRKINNSYFYRFDGDMFIDLHRFNWMMRKDGSAVANDPYSTRIDAKYEELVNFANTEYGELVKNGKILYQDDYEKPSEGNIRKDEWWKEVA